jgi:hypothetical protein
MVIAAANSLQFLNNSYMYFTSWTYQTVNHLEINITKISTENVQGTFNCLLTYAGNTTTVTNGQFNVPIK